jgi:dTDP-4-dehydrorhamnose 3,5-epimerase
LERPLRFEPTPLANAFHVEIDRRTDERGFFARTWCRDEFAAHGIDIEIAQANVSHNIDPGTLRGMHFQWPPSVEGKLIRCERGRVYDVIIDLRPNSATYTQHFAVTLDQERRNALYVPPGFAHGFQTLLPDSDVTYLMSDIFQDALADGVRYDDPVFAIAWPLPVSRILERDRSYPDFDHDLHKERYSAARSSTRLNARS